MIEKEMGRMGRRGTRSRALTMSAAMRALSWPGAGSSASLGTATSATAAGGRAERISGWLKPFVSTCWISSPPIGLLPQSSALGVIKASALAHFCVVILPTPLFAYLHRITRLTGLPRVPLRGARAGAGTHRGVSGHLIVPPTLSRH